MDNLDEYYITQQLHGQTSLPARFWQVFESYSSQQLHVDKEFYQKTKITHLLLRKFISQFVVIITWNYS